jgi:hypothetical protein
LLSCIYEPEQQQQLIDQLIDETLSGFTGQSLKDRANQFLRRLLRLASRLKHHSFSEEKEWRLVSVPLGERARFRRGRFSFLPYLDFSLDIDGRVPISEIVIGPTPEPELSNDAIMWMLHAYDYPPSSVQITHSEAPFRDW